MEDAYSLFRKLVLSIIDRVIEEEKENIEKAASLIAESLASGGYLYVFGTGHSSLMALELFYRAGGLVRVYPIIDPSLTGYSGALRSTLLERLPGYAEALLKSVNISPYSSIIVVSVSGKNSAPVEMALKARERGLKVIGLTSVAFSQRLKPDNPYGLRLFEVCDVVIDNKVPEGDAIYPIAGTSYVVAPVSTIVNSFILQLLNIRVAEKLIEKGLEPEIWVSSNLPYGLERNRAYLEKYFKDIKPL